MDPVKIVGRSPRTREIRGLSESRDMSKPVYFLKIEKERIWLYANKNVVKVLCGTEFTFYLK